MNIEWLRVSNRNAVFVLNWCDQGDLVLKDADGKELSNIGIRVRGNLAWSSVQGGNTQRRQAVASLDQRLLEENEKLK